MRIPRGTRPSKFVRPPGAANLRILRQRHPKKSHREQRSFQPFGLYSTRRSQIMRLHNWINRVLSKPRTIRTRGAFCSTERGSVGTRWKPPLANYRGFGFRAAPGNAPR
jgi:hypothetical protein